MKSLSGKPTISTEKGISLQITLQRNPKLFGGRYKYVIPLSVKPKGTPEEGRNM
jgi:hypothetical protein